jgi:hypothetical protein
LPSGLEPSARSSGLDVGDTAALGSQRSALAVIGRCLPKTWEDYRQPAFPLHSGATYEAWHPFKLEAYQPIPDDPDGGYPDKVNTWVPGWRYEDCGPEDVEEVWDGAGLQRRTVVSLHRPGPRYPERVFYTRQWVDPNGHVFGRSNLRCVIAPTFRAWLRGERWPTRSPARDAHVTWARTPSQADASDRPAMPREEPPPSSNTGGTQP